jgi:hypothetical protein
MAVTSTLGILQRIAPTLYADAAVQDWVDLAIQQLRTDEWANVYNQAVAYLAAHLWVLAMREAQALAGSTYGGPVGAITSESAGDLSRAYGSMPAPTSGGVSASDAEYQTTSYGLRFLSLRNSRPTAGPFLVDTDMA